MSRSVAEANREIGRVRALPYSLARSVAAEQVARRIEAEGPQEALAYALYTQLEAYSFGGEQAKAYVPFVRLNRLWDEHPELFDEWDRHGYFWSFKWIVNSLKDYPDTPAERIAAVLDEMRRRYTLAGLGASAVAHQEFSWAAHRDADDAERLLEVWMTTLRDDFSQCEGCTFSQQAEFHADHGRLDEALRSVSDALAAQNDCEWRTHTLAVAALLHLDLGQPAEAVAAHRQAVAALAKNPGRPWCEARGLRFKLLARGGQSERAFRALDEDAALLVEAESPLDRLRFLVHVLGGLAALDNEDAARPVSLPGVPAATAADLRRWVEAEADILATAFDARNGTDAWARQVRGALAARLAPRPLDFNVIGTDAAPPRAAEQPEAGRKRSPGSGKQPSAAAEYFLFMASFIAALFAAGWFAPSDQDWIAGVALLVIVIGWGGWLVHLVRRTRAAAIAATPQMETPDGPADADTLAARGDWTSAVPAYLARAEAAEAAGELEDAGLAWAETAHAADRVGDDEGAQRAYATGVTRLRAARASDSLLAQVLVAWAPVAVRLNDADLVLAESEAALQRVLTDEPEAAPDARLQERRDRERVRRRADLHDTIARIVASLPRPGVPGREIPDAIGHATQAAEDYAAAGRTADAAHAFWLAGRLQRDSDPAAAQWSLESAVEGFELVRDQGNRTLACSELIPLLQATGQEHRAAELAAGLTET